MTSQKTDDRHADAVPIALAIAKIVLGIAALIALVLSWPAQGQSGPCEATPSTLHCYLGSVSDDARMFVDTTSSDSPNALAGPPFDEVGENPTIVWRVKDIRYVDSVSITPSFVPSLAPSIGITFTITARVTGWVDIPLPSGKRLRDGLWVDDPELLIVVHVAEPESGLCNVEACGAVTVLKRMAKDKLVMAPTVVQVREIAR